MVTSNHRELDQKKIVYCGETHEEPLVVGMELAVLRMMVGQVLLLLLAVVHLPPPAPGSGKVQCCQGDCLHGTF